MSTALTRLARARAGGRRVRVAGLGSILVVAAGLGFAGSRLAVEAALPTCAAGTTVNCAFGGFEIDGNTASNGGLDWASSSVTGSAAYTNFYDLFNTTSDNIMSNGSKESDQITWSCVTNKAPGKADLGGPFYTTGQFAPSSAGVPWAGSIWFENTDPGKSDNVQYLFGNFQRFTTNGDVHLDYEFNKSTTLLSSGCTSLGVRSQGDVLITFDTNNGGAQIFVSAFKWVCTGSVSQGTVCPDGGSFQLAANLTSGVTFAGAANLPPAGGDAGVDSGAFGEAGLDLTHTIGDFTCGEFGNAYMKTRSAGTSDIANGKAEVKDFTTPVPFNPGLCPNSVLSKAQANETVQHDDGTAGTAEGSSADNTADAALTYTQDDSKNPLAVNPGDELVYRLDYQNTGGGPASGVTVTDSIPAGTSFVAGSCNPSCTTTGTPVTGVTWTLGAEAPGADVFLYFEVAVASTHTGTGTVTIENVGHLTATGETASDSNHVFAQASYAPASTLAKKEADVQSVSLRCNTASLGTVSSTSSCIEVPGALTPVASAPFVNGPINAAAGDTIAYQLTYTNNGTSDASGVTVTDDIPAKSTYLAGSCSSSCTTTLSGTTVTGLTWSLGTVAPGAAHAVTVTFEVTLDAVFPAWDGTGTAPAGNRVSNTGGVTSADEQSTIASNTVRADVSATGAPGMVKTVSAPFTGGTCPLNKTCVTWTIAYFNTGSGSLADQAITDTLPAGVTFVSCTTGNTAGCTSGASTPTTWTVDIPGGTSASNPAGTVTVTVSY